MITYGPMAASKVHYDASGAANAAEDAAFVHDVTTAAPKHLFVISHGWNNDEAEADDLYTRFFTHAGNVAAGIPFDLAACHALAVIWPSKKFDETAFAAAAQGAPAAGAAAGIAAPAIDAKIAAQLGELKEIAANPAAQALIDHAIAQIPMLGVSQSAQNDFVAALAAAFPQSPQEADPGLDTGLARLNDTQGHEVLQRIAAAQHVASGPSGVGGAAGIDLVGSAAGFNPLAAIKNAALVLANLTTYWTMKERAGVVGRTGVAQSLAKAMAAVPNAKVHLIGHSFGGRLVTAVANALTGGTAGHRADTMTLLQAAYSHYGMAHDYQPNTDGMFRSVITGGKVKSEIQITHSKHDIAVGLAYPLASALSRSIGAAAWVNPYGGMGGDGARSTPEAFDDTLHAAGTPYNAVQAPNIVRNLNGDDFISGHGDIANDQTAYAALLAASRA